MTLAIIPARGGSVRIPRKNIRPFAGRPLIEWPIAAARESGLFTRIVVSTDDCEIAEVARNAGADVPFMRPLSLAGDSISTDTVLEHALRECDARYGAAERACCIYPTAALISPQQLRQGLKLLEEHDAQSAFPLVQYDFPIEQAFALDGARPRARWPEKLEKRSQDLPAHYHDAGAFYWVNVPRFLQSPQLFSDDSVAFVLPPWVVQDINTHDDWERAELKFRMVREGAAQ